MDTSEKATLSISKEVLLQCMKDGKAYKELVQRMATIIYHEMKDDGLPDVLEIIQYGQENDFDNSVIKEEAKEFEQEAGVPIYAEADGRTVEYNRKNGWGDKKRVFVSRFIRWQHGE